jgi:hypothetical protein
MRNTSIKGHINYSRPIEHDLLHRTVHILEASVSNLTPLNNAKRPFWRRPMQKIPAIGHSWKNQSGVNAGLMRGAHGKPDYFLIIAMDDAGKNSSVEWGGYKTETAGANCEFDGLENTIALLQSGIIHPAAKWAAGVIIEDHKDFYLPSRREQSLMYANCPELFEEAWYWSSTQGSARCAWLQFFEDGHQGLGNKDYNDAARAVRRYYP